jgi:pimeloyl-ACP methyl ester carboxylesterase
MMLDVNGVRLHHLRTGDEGPPLVLVHGSWVDHQDWSGVVGDLAHAYQVVTYDRRGHSRSERQPGQGSLDEDAGDLAALIEKLDLAPAHVVGNSFGGSVALRLASRRPELFRSLSVHEPPLIDLLDIRAETRPMARAVRALIGGVADQIAEGDAAGGTRRFVEEIALGPGAWDGLPPELRQVFLNNAPTWLDETRDPQGFGVDLQALAAFGRPVLLTRGDQSPPMFAPILDVLATALPQARRVTLPGAGHVPHQSHPATFVSVLRSFLS